MTRHFYFPPIDLIRKLAYLLRGEFHTAKAAPLIKTAVANAGSIQYGTQSSGTWESTQADDGTNWVIDEVTGTPGFIITLTFAATGSGEAADRLHINGYYDGNIGHTVNVQMYDWADKEYDTVGTLPDAVAEADYVFDLSPEHTDTDGAVRLKINHTSPGSIIHNLYLDHVYIEDRTLTLEPGPGELTLVDSADQLSISGGKLIAASTVEDWTDPAFYEDTIRTRAAGLTAFSRTSVQASGAYFPGWFDSAQKPPTGVGSRDVMLRALGGVFRPNGLVTLPDTLALDTFYDVAIVLRTPGAFTFARINSRWKLMWVDNAEAGDVYLGGFDYNYGLTIDRLYAAQLAAPFATDNGYATAEDAGAVLLGATFTHKPNTQLDFINTTLPSAGSTKLKFRKQDADNGWEVDLNNDGSLRLYERVAATPTLRETSGAAALSGGERILIICDGQTITAYYDTTQAWSYALAVNFETETAAELASLGTGGAVSDLFAWPLYPSGLAVEQLKAYT